jgi:hypothetical protein
MKRRKAQNFRISSPVRSMIMPKKYHDWSSVYRLVQNFPKLTLNLYINVHFICCAFVTVLVRLHVSAWHFSITLP